MMKVLLSLAVAISAVVATDIPIAVGNGGLKFNPNSATAAVGDTLVFSFYDEAHAVAQASADKACQPLDGGFYSGTVEGTDPPTTEFTYTVQSTDPIYYYCPVGPHCQKGMVGVINPSKGNGTFQQYLSLSKAATSNVAPNVVAGTGGSINHADGASNSTTSTNGTTSTTNTTTAATTTSASSTSTSSSKSDATNIGKDSSLVAAVVAFVVFLYL